uniref:Hypoxanthine phosphoribosyltransferase n=1 Tax=Hordeum vulgare subsp. vulgare TaxID=112509 RepID=F2DZR0_HORVV|nr:predicted protein [Hordeum vulgare subsp. vulgare]
MHPDLEEVLFDEEQIKSIIQTLADRINHDYKDTECLMLVGILKGSFIFMSDLVRKLTVPVRLEFMSVSSYGSATTSSGVVRIDLDLKKPIDGKDVLIVEDIIDTGHTLKYLLESLGARKPKSLEVTTLLQKKEALKTDVTVKYVGVDIPLKFVIGYGLDYDERYRELPVIGVLRESVYKK